MSPGPIETLIRDKLTAAFSPARLEVRNDSSRHAGHLPAGEETGETHFSVKLVSADFAGLGRIERHRRVHRALGAEIEAGLHALAIKALSPEEAA